MGPRVLSRWQGLVAGSKDTESRIVGEKPEKGSTRIWDVATGRERRRFPVEEFHVRSVAVSPDGKLRRGRRHRPDHPDLRPGHRARAFPRFGQDACAPSRSGNRMKGPCRRSAIATITW